MTQLAKDTPRKFDNGIEPVFNDLPVLTAIVIYAGAALGHSGGYARQFADGDEFCGFAVEGADNTAGASGAITVKTRSKGAIEIPVTGADATKLGDVVYLTDSNTFSLTDSGSDTVVGRVLRHVSGTTCLVYFEALALRSI